jgi:hypothetical protein
LKQTPPPSRALHEDFFKLVLLNACPLFFAAMKERLDLLERMMRLDGFA